MKKITLDQDNFKHFFSSVGPLHSHHEHPEWPYDYVDRGSDTLLVTIGDSWTWGSGIDPSWTVPYQDLTHISTKENDFRVNNLYGNLISKDRGWNWLNLGFYAMGNQWIADKVFELRGLVPHLEFKKIIVMCVLTGTARWFHTWQDGRTDYKTYFANNAMTEIQHYENFLININKEVIGQITHLANSAGNVRLLVGTNGVDHCGFDPLREEQIIPLPWYRLLTDTKLNGISVDIDSIKYLPSIENYLSSDQKFAFQKWMMTKIDQAEKQTDMIKQMHHASTDGFHPNHNGHRIWAEYILQKVL
jgi:hypothetical protein|tara:strand:- start:461 stop:1369 length:909 start_codon:yes stop_codon:yes gene_type:complete